MENKMEATIVRWENLRIMENKMETTIGAVSSWCVAMNQGRDPYS